LRGVVLQKNNRGKWEDKKWVRKKIASPSCAVFLFEFPTHKFQSPSNYRPMYSWKNETSLQRESLGFGYCENPQIAGFTLSWSSTDLEREREREREKL
jgi:hypothetical protein